MKKSELRQLIREVINEDFGDFPTKKEAMETDKIKLSEFIEIIKDSLKKIPKVKNYDKLKQLLPQIEKILKVKGDIRIPMDGLMQQFNLTEDVIKEEAKTSYTKSEVTDLLTAYRSDGNYSIDEVKLRWPNSYPVMRERAEEWLDNIAYMTIADKAKYWFDKVISKDYAIQLRHSNKGKSDEEIYITTMLK